jgi:hypothetical protein
MNQNLTTWFEIIFDVVYLIVVWGIVTLMMRTLKSVSAGDQRTARLIQVAFALLALGDTGHVGFRVLAELMGGADASVTFLGTSMSLVGLGMLTTAFTVTLFYMLFVYVWKARFEQRFNWFTNLLLFAGLVRLIFMALPGNDWGNVVPPQPISLYRNIPLLIQGIGVIGLILFSAYKHNDVTFKWIGWLTVVSYAFYTPVILFAQQYPLVGMLMIPKTCAYLAIAWVAYQGLWKQPHLQPVVGA